MLVPLHWCRRDQQWPSRGNRVATIGWGLKGVWVRPRGSLLIMVLLIVSERNSTQVRLGKTRSFLEGLQRPQETGTGTSPGPCCLCFCVSASFSPTANRLLLTKKCDCYSHRLATSLLRLPLILFQKVPVKNSDWLTGAGCLILGLSRLPFNPHG